MPTGFRRLKSIPTFMLSLILIMQAASLAAQPSPSEPAVDGELEVLHVQGNVWLIAGAGGNIAVQAGEQGVVVVDTGASGFGSEVIAAIAKISDRPIRYIINTSIADQHIGGNDQIALLPGGSTSGAERGVITNTVSLRAWNSLCYRCTGFSERTPFNQSSRCGRCRPACNRRLALVVVLVVDLLLVLLPPATRLLPSARGRGTTDSNCQLANAEQRVAQLLQREDWFQLSAFVICCKDVAAEGADAGTLVLKRGLRWRRMRGSRGGGWGCCCCCFCCCRSSTWCCRRCRRRRRHRRRRCRSLCRSLYRSSSLCRRRCSSRSLWLPPLDNDVEQVAKTVQSRPRREAVVVEHGCTTQKTRASGDGQSLDSLLLCLLLAQHRALIPAAAV